MNRIAIWAEPRTGSTYLVDVVTQYLYINNPGIPVYRQKEVIYHEYNTFVLNMNAGIPMCIRSHLEHFPYWEKLNLGQYINNFYNIFLYRKNMFEQIVSNWIGNTTRVWATNDLLTVQKLSQQTYTIPENEFLDLIQLRWTELNDNYTKVNYDVTIVYEDLTFEYDTDIRSIGLIPDYPLTKQTRTQKLPKKQNQIENWNQLKQIYMEEISKYNSNNFYFDENGMLYVNKK